MEALNISARRFGPISDASMSLRPLTIFVGSNNTGKSYMAQLIYAVCRASSDVRRDYYHFGFEYDRPYLFDTLTLNDDEQRISMQTLDSLRKFLPDNFPDLATRHTSPSQRRVDIPFNKLPEELKVMTKSYISDYLSLFRASFVKELERCFDTKISKLVCKLEERSKSFGVNIENSLPQLNLSFLSEGNNLRELKKDFTIEDSIINANFPRIDRPPFSRYAERMANTSDSDERKYQYLMQQFMKSIIVNSEHIIENIFPRRSFYLPAARSGILVGQKAIVRSGIRSLERAGIEPISIPRLPGTVIDFLEAIYSIDRDEPGEFYELAKFLEHKLIPGRIEFVEGKNEASEIYFRQPTIGRLALHRSSSMISELAPVILLLRYLVRRGDMVIVEEPESHMHPAAQREIAIVLAKLVNNDVNVIITTHSDYLLQQLSNLVALSTKAQEVKEKVRYEPDELLSPEKVSVFLFKSGDDICGNTVVPLEVGENGIDEQGFGIVAESLYDEALEVKGD